MPRCRRGPAGGRHQPMRAGPSSTGSGRTPMRLPAQTRTPMRLPAQTRRWPQARAAPIRIPRIRAQRTRALTREGASAQAGTPTPVWTGPPRALRRRTGTTLPRASRHCSRRLDRRHQDDRSSRRPWRPRHPWPTFSIPALRHRRSRTRLSLRPRRSCPAKTHGTPPQAYPKRLLLISPKAKGPPLISPKAKGPPLISPKAKGPPLISPKAKGPPRRRSLPRLVNPNSGRRTTLGRAWAAGTGSSPRCR